jgi:hypothetical protein
MTRPRMYRRWGSALTTLTWKDQNGRWTTHLFVVIALAVIGVVLVITSFEAALEDWWTRDGLAATIGLALVAYALVRALVAVFGPRPEDVDAARRSDAWRIGWSVGGLTTATLVLTGIVFAFNDDMRATGTADSGSCAVEPSDQATGGAEDDAATGSGEIDTGPGNATPTVTSGPALAGEPVTTEEFGFERGVQSTTILLTTAEGANAHDLVPDDFRAVSDDGRASTGFAAIHSVTALGPREALLRVTIDLSCHSGMEGGEFDVRAVYDGTVGLDHQTWTVRVTLQSRLLFYFLALLPVIVVGAMFQVFSMWPDSLKRWFTSVIAILVPVLTAYRVAGLGNATWHPDLVTSAGLIGATYAAAVTAANLVKNGGHDLGAKT